MTADPFTVLCVCTGNVARSPAAERLLDQALGAAVRVRSAGTSALVGEGFSAPMDALVAQHGGDPAGFVARQVSPALLREADLVLGLSREHRALTVDLAPATVRRTFTLREYARLLVELGPDALPGGSVAERLRASVPLAGARRRRVAEADDDVADPYRRGDRAYASACDQIAGAVRDIAVVLRP